MWQEIISTIERHQTFILTTHVNPDCDAFGSELALAEHLRKLGKKVSIINSDSIPAPYRFLDPKRQVKKYSVTKHRGVLKKCDVVIVLDASGGWGRTGRIGENLAKTDALKLCIDHHPDSADF
ncbi:MAG: DHH family phosphoesterase, partial [Chloroflexota bacterium]